MAIQPSHSVTGEYLSGLPVHGRLLKRALMALVEEYRRFAREEEKKKRKKDTNNIGPLLQAQSYLMVRRLRRLFLIIVSHPCH